MNDDGLIKIAIDKHEAHDRYQHFTKTGQSIEECCQDLVDQRPFGDHPFYIFAHTRTAEDGFRSRMIWQPRLTKPHAQTNSMLFKAYPGTDHIKVIWMIPDRSLWNQYAPGLITANKTVQQSIADFITNRDRMEAKEDDDLSEEAINMIYKQIALSAKPRMPY